MADLSIPESAVSRAALFQPWTAAAIRFLIRSNVGVLSNRFIRLTFAGPLRRTVPTIFQTASEYAFPVKAVELKNHGSTAYFHDLRQ